MKLLDVLCKGREFEQALAKNRQRLFRIAFAWSHNSDIADDLVQEACSKALRQRKQLRDMDSLGPWLFRILKNTWHDYLRCKKEMIEYDESVYADEQTPESVNSRYETVQRVRQAMQSLPIGQREVLTLVDLERCSYAEVAEILEIPAGTVMSRLCRARRHLKAILLDQVASQEGSAEVVKLRSRRR